MLTGDIAYRQFKQLIELKQQQTYQDRRVTRAARQSLLHYMILRSRRPFNIARARGSPIEPRLLMLPCPDTLADNNLDGTQDPACAADGSSNNDVVNGILDSGSRFGRLPYSFGYVISEQKISDGLGEDFHDSSGNRLWYAVSQNITPSISPKPLNLHRLSTIPDKWLTITRPDATSSTHLVTVDSRTLAVILAPGKHKQGRLSEFFITKNSLDLNQVRADSYFESTLGQSNSDTDGVFVQAQKNRVFDDSIAYIGLDKLLAADGIFMRNYKKIVGVSETHNAPLTDSPLANVRQAVTDWKNFFGYYPMPATNNLESVNNLFRQCTVRQTTAANVGKTFGGDLLLPAKITVNTSAVTNLTITVASAAGFLAAQPLTVLSTSNALITLARYARLTLTTGQPLIISANILQTLDFGHLLPAGVTVFIAAGGTVMFADKTPLATATRQSGWLPEHYSTTIAARDGSALKLGAPVIAGFLGTAVITSARQTMTVNSQYRFLLSGKLKMEEDFPQLRFLYEDAVLQKNDNTTITLRAADNFSPTPQSFAKRHFVVLILSDIIRNNNTIYAPKIIYPWNAKISERARANTRDNLHPYPPCFDSRNLQRQTRTFVENQNIYYIVAPGCHYGGSQECGQTGLSLRVSPGARIAAAAPFTLSLSHTVAIVTLAAAPVTVSLEIRDGRASHNLTLPRSIVLPIDDEPTPARIHLPKGYVFTADVSIVAPAGAIITGGERTFIKNIHALLIYSPAPLSNVSCSQNMPTAYVANTLTLSSQGKAGADLTNACQWLDDDENADGDLLYVARAPARRAPTSNDFIMFFGGEVVLE